MFFDNKVESHSLVMGASGKGKSVLSEQVRKNARLRGDLLVDTEMYREGRGLKPYGHCCKVSDEAAFCLIQRPYISKTLLTRRISPRGSP
ncbi:hypothetical protein FE172_26620 (plasmid) [Escherichia coli]|nr:hypothetical protein FE172_26620 [Escherichia coli]